MKTPTHFISSPSSLLQKFYCLLFFILLVANTSRGQVIPSYSQGIGTTDISDMMPSCPSNHITPLGHITATDGTQWNVPADVHFNSATHLYDLHNTCNGVSPTNLSQVNLSAVPEVIIDQNGQTITAYLFCDNYFELYINGVLVGVDAVPFTPFNSSIAKFRVSYPYTVAVKLLDWEEHPGIGSEIQATDNYHPGDGGFIAKFSDGTVTDTTWKAQVFYISPLGQAGGINVLADGTRSTAGVTNAPTCNANCFAAHYPVDSGWANPLFDDNSWPKARPYTAAQVTNQPAYVNFANTAWNGAQFIWSSNLILDNLVLTRKTVSGMVGVQNTTQTDNWQVAEITGRKIVLIAPENCGSSKISLYDLSGKKLLEWKNEDSNGMLTLNMPPNMDGGNQLYILRIEDKTGTYNKKISLVRN